MFGFKLPYLFKFLFYVSCYNMYRYTDINVEDLLSHASVSPFEILLRPSKFVKCLHENVSCIHVTTLSPTRNSG